jgi:hypothetical protein
MIKHLDTEQPGMYIGHRNPLRLVFDPVQVHVLWGGESGAPCPAVVVLPPSQVRYALSAPHVEQCPHGQRASFRRIAPVFSGHQATPEPS